MDEHPPKVRYTLEAEESLYAAKANRVGIYYTSGDRVVAFIEIVSPGNKNNQLKLTQLLEKLAHALADGRHFAVVDIPEPDGAMICWCVIARDGLPIPASFPLIGMPAEIEKTHGQELLVAQVDRLRELRDKPTSPLPAASLDQVQTLKNHTGRVTCAESSRDGAELRKTVAEERD